MRIYEASFCDDARLVEYTLCHETIRDGVSESTQLPMNNVQFLGLMDWCFMIPVINQSFLAPLANDSPIAPCMSPWARLTAFVNICKRSRIRRWPDDVDAFMAAHSRLWASAGKAAEAALAFVASKHCIIFSPIRRLFQAAFATRVSVSDAFVDPLDHGKAMVQQRVLDAIGTPNLLTCADNMLYLLRHIGKDDKHSWFLYTLLCDIYELLVEHGPASRQHPCMCLAFCREHDEACLFNPCLGFKDHCQYNDLFKQMAGVTLDRVERA